MSNATIYDELDRAVSALMADSEGGDVASYVSTQGCSDELRELLEAAGQLEYVARPEFKTQLRADLLDEMFVSADVASYVSTHDDGRNPDHGNSNGNGSNGTVARTPRLGSAERILPSLFGGENVYQAQPKNFAASALLHAGAVSVLIASSLWTAQRAEPKPRITTVLTQFGVYAPEPAREKQRKGGGSGGDRSPMVASKGQPPKFAYEQLAPPTVIVRNPQAVLTVEPTVLGPPTSLPQLSKLGDPLSRVTPASNGIGSASAIGSNFGTGVSNGTGPGAGSGSGGGMGTGVFQVGGGVSAPRQIYGPDPEYSEEARKAKYQGKVVLWAIIGADGLPKDIRVQQRLGMGLDENAMAAVRQWRFDPARKGGQPVAVQVNIELTFRLY